MSDKLETAIVSALEGDAVSFKDAIHAALGDKVQSAIAAKRVEYSSALFGDNTESETEEEEIEQEEESDENVQ